MAVAVVDRFETVEVEVGNRQQAVRALNLRNRLIQAVGQQDAVGQLRQRVVMGDKLEFVLVAFALGDVVHQGDDALGVADFGHAQVDLDPELLAVKAARQPVEGLRTFLPRQTQLFRGFDHSVGLDIGRKFCMRSTQCLCARAPIHFAHALVDVEQVAIRGVVDEKGIRRRVEDGAKAALAFGQLLDAALHVGGHEVEIVGEHADFIPAGDGDGRRIVGAGDTARGLQQGGNVARDQVAAAGKQQQRQQNLAESDPQALLQNVAAQ